MIARAATLLAGAAALASALATGCTDDGPANPHLAVAEDGSGGLTIEYTRTSTAPLGELSATVGGQPARLVAATEPTDGTDGGCQSITGCGPTPTDGDGGGGAVAAHGPRVAWASPVVVGADGVLAVEVVESGVHYQLTVPSYGAPRTVAFAAPSAPLVAGETLRAQLAVVAGDRASGVFELEDDNQELAAAVDASATGSEVVGVIPAPLYWTAGEHGLVAGYARANISVVESVGCVGDGLACESFVHDFRGDRVPVQVQLPE